MEQELGPNAEAGQTKTNVIKVVIIILLFAGSLFLLWRERVNRPEVTSAVLTGEESTLVVKTVNESTDYTNIDVQIPQFTNASKDFNQKIDQSIRERMTEHKDDAEENWRARFETQSPGDDVPNVPGQGAKMYFYAKFDVPEQNNKKYISVLMHIGGYTGGAHGYEEVVSYNYDVQTSKSITLAEIFPNDPGYLTKISEICRRVLLDRFSETLAGEFDNKAEQDAYVNNSLRPSIFDGTDPTKPENFANFTFNENKLIIHFNQYQVGPYVLGLQNVEIPLPLQ